MLVAALDKLRGDRARGGPLLDPEAEVQLEGSRTRTPQPLSHRERVGEAIAASSFVVAAVLLAVYAPWERTLSAPLAAWLVLLYFVAFRVRFAVGAAYTAPTQLVFIPMLFLLPIPIVPLLVAAANFLGAAPDFFGGRRHPERAITSLSNSWNALGPALVLVAAGAGQPTLDQWPLYLAALGGPVPVRAAGEHSARVVRVRDPAARPARRDRVGVGRRRAALGARPARRAGRDGAPHLGDPRGAADRAPGDVRAGAAAAHRQRPSAQRRLPRDHDGPRRHRGGGRRVHRRAQPHRRRPVPGGGPAARPRRPPAAPDGVRGAAARRRQDRGARRRSSTSPAR